MPTLLVVLSLLAALAAGCSTSSTARPPSPAPADAQASTGDEAVPGPTVHLRFAWPAGLALRVQTRKTKDKQGRIGISETSSDLRVEAMDDGWRVTEDNYRLAGTAGAAQAADASMTSLMQETRAIIEVETDGKFRRVANAQEAIDLSLRLVGEHASPTSIASMKRVMTPALVEGLAQADWNDRVGFWLGAEIELGATYELRSQGVVPLPGQPEMAFVTRFGAVAMVPCIDGEPPRCVQLETETTIDPASFASAVDALGTGVTKDGVRLADKVAVEHLEVITTTRLITDPDTLIPYRFTKTKHLDMSIRTAEGPNHSVSHEETHNVYARAKASDEQP